jgi:nicotinamidase-related amidase
VKPRPRTLLIVDLQQAFTVPPGLVEGIRRYARRFDRRVFTRFVNPGDSLFRRMLHQHCCHPNSPDTKLLIEPGPDDVLISKHGYGLPPAAIRKIKALGAKEIIVCGIDTDACVLGVMFSLFDSKIPCRLKARYCWSSSGLHRPALRIIRSQFAVLD